MGDIQLKAVSVPYDALEGLGPKGQYCLNLLAHIFNEIMAINKYAMMSSRRSDAEELSNDAEKAGYVFNSIFFAKMLAAKLHEAHLSLRSPVLHDFLRNHIYPKNAEAHDLLRKFNKAARESKWLAPARNGHAMHFPEFSEWERAIGAMAVSKQPFKYFIGERMGDALYWSADVVAGSSFFDEVGMDGWRDAVVKVLNDVREIGALLCDFIVAVIEGFVDIFSGKGVPYNKRVRVKDVPKFYVPAIDDSEIPFFFDSSGH